MAVFLAWGVLLLSVGPTGGHSVAREPVDASGVPAIETVDTLNVRVQLAQGWQLGARKLLMTDAGARWDSSAGWTLEPHWRYADTATAPLAYYLEHALRPALTVAEGLPDRRLLDELAGFFVAYHGRFVTLGTMRRRAERDGVSQLLDGQGPDSTLTLSWLQVDGPTRRWRECTLCNAQFLHPAARLLKIIAAMPPATRSANEREFARLYAPLIVDEHLLRLLYVARWPFPDPRIPNRLIDAWARLKVLPKPAQHAYYDAVQDRDLWLMATAAEVLGANKLDPAVVNLSPTRRAQLERIVNVGVSLVASRRHSHVVRSSTGERLFADSYFDGDYDDHPDMRYAADTGPSLPSGPEALTHGHSWDVSHIYRLPVLFRSLIDNHAALETAFPDRTDLEDLINQYVFVVFRGGGRRPVPTNFFDGSDGWYRVTATGGYAPSQYCDSRIAGRACLSAEAALYGWELLAFASAPLQQLQASLLTLAASMDSTDIEFRARHYTQGHQAFVVQGGRTGYSLPVYTLFSAKVDKFR